MKLLYSATLYQYEEKSSIIELRFILFYLFFKFYLFLAALGLRCCARAFSSCSEWGLLFVAVHGLLIAVASLVAEHGPQSVQASVVAARGLSSCSAWALGLLGFSSCVTWAQQLWRMGLVTPRHVGSSRTRSRTHVPCIGRQILNHCATREVQGLF